VAHAPFRDHPRHDSMLLFGFHCVQPGAKSRHSHAHHNDHGNDHWHTLLGNSQLNQYAVDVNKNRHSHDDTDDNTNHDADLDHHLNTVSTEYKHIYPVVYTYFHANLYLFAHIHNHIYPVTNFHPSIYDQSNHYSIPNSRAKQYAHSQYYPNAISDRVWRVKIMSDPKERSLGSFGIL